MSLCILFVRSTHLLHVCGRGASMVPMLGFVLVRAATSYTCVDTAILMLTHTCVHLVHIGRPGTCNITTTPMPSGGDINYYLPCTNTSYTASKRAPNGTGGRIGGTGGAETHDPGQSGACFLRDVVLHGNDLTHTHSCP